MQTPTVVGQTKRLGERLLERGDVSAQALIAALERQRKLREQRLGDLLVERRLVTRHNLEVALDAQAASPGEPLGQVMVSMGLLVDADLECALEEQEENRRKPIGEILVELGMIKRATLLSALAAFGILASGCSSTATDMVKAYEPVGGVLIQWRKVAPQSCGGVQHAYGCAKVSHQGAMCVIELPEDAPDWALAHEIKHCFGYVHKHGPRPQFAANFGK